MIRFLKRFLLFSILPVLYVLTVLLIDPFDYFSLSKLVSAEQKAQVIATAGEGMPSCQAMLKTMAYKRNPLPNVILGDSRQANLDVDSLKAVTGLTFSNLAVPGGDLKTLCQSFWMVDTLTELKNVYINVGFKTYNAFNSNRSFMDEARFISETPPAYFFSRHTRDALLRHGKIFLKGMPEKKEGSNRDQEKVWNTMLKNLSNSYKHPTHWYEELQRIVSHCERNGIQLVVICYPEHREQREAYFKKGYEAYYQQYKKDLSIFPLVYDFDYDNEITRDKSLFRDPVHLTKKQEMALIREVFAAQPSVARVYGKNIQ